MRKKLYCPVFNLNQEFCLISVGWLDKDDKDLCSLISLYVSFYYKYEKAFSLWLTKILYIYNS